jgi:hypothetical protein
MRIFYFALFVLACAESELVLAENPSQWEALNAYDRPALASVVACDPDFNASWTLGVCDWIDNDEKCGGSGMYWYTEESNNIYAKCQWDAAAETCSVGNNSPTVCVISFYEAPADNSPSDSAAFLNIPNEWSILDQNDRPSVASVATCPDGFNATNMKGGCSWIVDEAACIDKGMFWFSADDAHVYAMCAWDGASCGHSTTTCSLTFVNDVAPNVTFAVATDDDEVLAPTPHLIKQRKHQKSQEPHVTTPIGSTRSLSADLEAHNDYYQHLEPMDTSKLQEEVENQPVHHHKPVMVKSSNTAATNDAVVQKFNQMMEAAVEEEPETETDPFLAELAAKQDSYNQAAIDDFRTNLMNSVDTAALQQHYVQNNIIAQTNLANTAIGLSNLIQNGYIQQMNAEMESSWGANVPDPDLPEEIAQQSVAENEVLNSF